MTAAIIDIGSNSIKSLVAARESDGRLVALGMKTLDARISAGIGGATPLLSEEGMARGLAAIRELLDDAAPFSPQKTVLVATSAVRDAANGADFAARVLTATGHPIRILSGHEEANLIGRGLTCDPALSGLCDFYLFDLGGGSLECLSFRNRVIGQAISLPLGCVRMTERCVADPTAPLAPATRLKLIETTKEVLAKSGFRFDLPPRAVAIGTGGSLTTARALLAARAGKTLETTGSLVAVDQLRELLSHVGNVNLADRRRLPAMPAARADVLPAALATVIAVAEHAGITAFHNSLYNLRWGLAAEALLS